MTDQCSFPFFDDLFCLTEVASRFLQGFSDWRQDHRKVYMEMLKEVATDQRTQVVIDLADVMTFEEETTSAGLTLATHIAKNTRRYVDLFQSAIDAILPDTISEEMAADLAAKANARDDVINIIIQRRRQRLADRLAENADENADDLFPPALLRK